MFKYMFRCFDHLMFRVDFSRVHYVCSHVFAGSVLMFKNTSTFRVDQFSSVHYVCFEGLMLTVGF